MLFDLKYSFFLLSSITSWILFASYPSCVIIDSSVFFLTCFPSTSWTYPIFVYISLLFLCFPRVSCPTLSSWFILAPSLNISLDYSFKFLYYIQFWFLFDSSEFYLLFIPEFSYLPLLIFAASPWKQYSSVLYFFVFQSRLLCS